MFLAHNDTHFGSQPTMVASTPHPNSRHLHSGPCSLPCRSLVLALFVSSAQLHALSFRIAALSSHTSNYCTQCLNSVTSGRSSHTTTFWPCSDFASEIGRRLFDRSPAFRCREPRSYQCCWPWQRSGWC